jgi:hypothetical protein
MVHAIAGHAIVIGCMLLATIFGVLLGRVWRRQYKAAMAHRFDLEQRAASTASASAQASGNVVDIHVNSEYGRESVGRGEFYLPDSVRAGLDWRAARRTEEVASGHVSSLPVAVDDYRPTAASRLLFGSGRALSRRDDFRERGDARGEEQLSDGA